jgi:hypothetical protein
MGASTSREWLGKGPREDAANRKRLGLVSPGMAGPMGSMLNFALHPYWENIPAENGKSNMVMSDIRRHRLAHFASCHQRRWKPSLDDSRAVVKPALAENYVGLPIE